MIAVSSEIEKTVQKSISCYVSQGEIIKGLVKSREERLCQNGMYIEPYIFFDPRPKLNFEPYKEFVAKYVKP